MAGTFILVQKGVDDNGRFFFALGSEIGFLNLPLHSLKAMRLMGGRVITMTEDLVINAATFVYKDSVAGTQALLTGLLTNP